MWTNVAAAHHFHMQRPAGTLHLAMPERKIKQYNTASEHNMTQQDADPSSAGHVVSQISTCLTAHNCRDGRMTCDKTKPHSLASSKGVPEKEAGTGCTGLQGTPSCALLPCKFPACCASSRPWLPAGDSRVLQRLWRKTWAQCRCKFPVFLVCNAVLHTLPHEPA